MIDRRVFVGNLVRLAALTAVVPRDWRVSARPRFVEDPFKLGVASGDPEPESVILWTRLAPRPLDPDGGMVGDRIAVRWEVAEDEGFAKVVQRGTATAISDLAYSIHVDVQGLSPDRWYFYRFLTGDAASPIGRTRTTPALHALVPLRFAFASCQHYEQGLFTAHRHLAAEDIDLLAFLGDYIYENAPRPNVVRPHVGPMLMTLADYRLRYAQAKTDPDLQASHVARPWVATWDDHEVANNYAGLVSADTTMGRDIMRRRRAAAYQAWWEHQPVRLPVSGDWSNLNITRRLNWGMLAQFSFLDTRQFRSDQACGDGRKDVPCGEWADPARTMMGERQERWLSDGLQGSQANWQVIANQVMVAPFDGAAGDGQRVSMDQWSGYPAARDRMLGEIATHAANRTVILTGDIHSSWVNELHSSFSRPDAPVVAAELVGTSISSGGDGNDRNLAEGRLAADNPHIRWQNSRRGYVRCVMAPEELRAEYRTVEYVSRPGAPIGTPSGWIVRRGVAGIERA